MGSNPYLGQVVMFGGRYAPTGYALCNGQLLLISQNSALFSIIGTTYGGDGTQNFALPNLQGASPLHPGTGAGLTPRTFGEAGGSVNVTLTTAQLPSHTHLAEGVAAVGTQQAPTNGVWAEIRGLPYAPTPNSPMSQNAISPAGGNQPHNNMPPYQVVTFIIALTGLFPSRS